MSTSIVDFIFRELAMTYLGRYDMVHIPPTDKKHLKPHPKPHHVSQANHKLQGLVPQGLAPQAGEQFFFVSPPATDDGVHISSSGGLSLQQGIQKVQLAQMKGYEGDPCAECGQFTMVRNGACLKCDSCGSTSGCS